jgi:hypothetical protein
MKKTFTVLCAIAIITGAVALSSCGGPDSSGDANRGMGATAGMSPAASPATTGGTSSGSSPSGTASPSPSPQQSPTVR